MRNKNIIVNILSFFAALISLFSGIIIWLALPARQGAKGRLGGVENGLFWGVSRYDWINLHNISSLIFVGLIIAHLVLHWQWIKNMPKMIKAGR